MKIKCNYCKCEKEQGTKESDMCKDCENEFLCIYLNQKISKMKGRMKSYV